MLIILFFFVTLFINSYLNASYRRNEDDNRIITLLPKIELHAHLHGSIRRETLQELSIKQGIGIDLKNTLDLEDCFKLFKVIQQIISTKSILQRIINEVLHDYMQENTIYLELRTTPRYLSDGTTLQDYIDIVVGCIEQHNQNLGNQMLVKLIISIDRSQPYQNAIHILNLITNHISKYSNETTSKTNEHSSILLTNIDNHNHNHNDIHKKVNNNLQSKNSRTIVGIDFSGNPYGSEFNSFLEVFQQARDIGLKITIHTAEISEQSSMISDNNIKVEDETSSILKFRPERIGHALYLQDYHLQMLVELNEKNLAPFIEICLTSNYYTLKLNNRSEHPQLKQLITLNYPISINTDDRGVFNTSLTDEWKYIMDILHIDIIDVITMLSSSIDHIFASDNEKIIIQNKFQLLVSQILNNNPELSLNIKIQNMKNNIELMKILDDSYFIYNY